MVIIDAENNVIEDPDFGIGTVESETVNVRYEYVVDVDEESHEEVIAEYPETGGKDIAVVVDVPEQGHWKATALFEGGEEEIDWADEVPSDWPHEPSETVIAVQRYRLYTEDELAEMERQKAEAEAAAEKAAEREAFIEAAPQRIDDTEQAVAELGVLAADSVTTLDDVLDAIAELGAIVASN